jgi:hypothetical protein
VITVTKLSARLAYSFNKNETNAIMDIRMLMMGRGYGGGMGGWRLQIGY